MKLARIGDQRVILSNRGIRYQGKPRISSFKADKGVFCFCFLQVAKIDIH